jgi:hypothetical protein
MVEIQVSQKSRKIKAKLHHLERRRIPPRKGRLPHQSLRTGRKLRQPEPSLRLFSLRMTLNFIVAAVNDTSLEITKH